MCCKKKRSRFCEIYAIITAISRRPRVPLSSFQQQTFVQTVKNHIQSFVFVVNEQLLDSAKYVGFIYRPFEMSEQNCIMH